MPQTECPICLGTGVIKEDANQYEFVTREPISSRCLICNGSGKVWPCSKLPNGVAMHEMKAEKEQQKRLNVSKKAAINPEVVDTGLGYQPDPPMEEAKREPYEKPMFLEMALNPRLNKVLASGKEFLIVTETEPYYLDVYRMIRKQEKKQGTWTAEDEERYIEALEDRIKELDSCLRRNDDGNDTSISYKEAMNG